MSSGLKIGLLWRAEWDPAPTDASIIESCKLREMFAAFSALGVSAEPVIYSDDTADAVRDQLLGLDGVLIWVNPIEQGLDRSKLDPLLHEVADAGVWVSAHPGVISKMATKQVLVDTRKMSWGTDTRLYRTAAELRSALPSRLAEQTALVLKRHRGMGGNGVWKVEWGDPKDAILRVQHAVRESVPEQLALDEFVDRCDPYFDGGGFMVEQPFHARLAEGMIRVYLTHNQVVGFAHQYPQGLLPPAEHPRTATAKTFELASAAAYRELRSRVDRSGCRRCRRSSTSTRTPYPSSGTPTSSTARERPRATTRMCCVKSTPAPPSPSQSTQCPPLQTPRSNAYRSGRNPSAGLAEQPHTEEES